ncbi:hypothetical protein ISS85_04540 [Candidatus Microgenomates bacterium]|nr:hypothetical protein [Candidatus Microgenomates bacterium]
MTQTIAVNTSAITEILKTLKAVKEELAIVREKLETAPPYGSAEWWQWSIKRGLQEIEEKKFETFKSVDDYLKDLETRA